MVIVERPRTDPDFTRTPDVPPLEAVAFILSLRVPSPFLQSTIASVPAGADRETRGNELALDDDGVGAAATAEGAVPSCTLLAPPPCVAAGGAGAGGVGARNSSVFVVDVTDAVVVPPVVRCCANRDVCEGTTDFALSLKIELVWARTLVLGGMVLLDLTAVRYPELPLESALFLSSLFMFVLVVVLSSRCESMTILRRSSE